MKKLQSDKKKEILTITRPPCDKRFKSLLRFTLANISIITSTSFHQQTS